MDHERDNEFSEHRNRIPLRLNTPSSTEGAEVLYKTVTLQGEPLSSWLFGKLQEPNNVGVVLFGESGAAKTTLAGQITREIMRLSGGRAWITVISSGVSLTGIERELTSSMRRGIDYQGNPIPPLAPDEEFDRSKFTPDIWRWAASYLAGDLKSAIEQSLRPDSHQRSRPKVVMADIAGIGEKNARLAAGLGEVAREFPENVIFLAAPANPDIQERALRLRKKSNLLLETLLLSRGRERLMTTDNINQIGELTVEEQEAIQNTLINEGVATDIDLVPTLASIREGTRPGRFEQAREVFLKEVLDWTRRADWEKEVYPVFGRLRSFQTEDAFIMADKSREGLYELKLAYAQNYLHRVLGISPDSDQGRVVLIPFLKDTTIHQWIELLHQKSG